MAVLRGVISISSSTSTLIWCYECCSQCLLSMYVLIFSHEVVKKCRAQHTTSSKIIARMYSASPHSRVCVLLGTVRRASSGSLCSACFRLERIHLFRAWTTCRKRSWCVESTMTQFISTTAQHALVSFIVLLSLNYVHWTSFV